MEESLAAKDMSHLCMDLAHCVVLLDYHMMMQTKVCHVHCGPRRRALDEIDTCLTEVLFGVYHIFGGQN